VDLLRFLRSGCTLVGSAAYFFCRFEELFLARSGPMTSLSLSLFDAGEDGGLSRCDGGLDNALEQFDGCLDVANPSICSSSIVFGESSSLGCRLPGTITDFDGMGE